MKKIQILNVILKMEESLVPGPVDEYGLLGVALDPLVPLESIMADSLSIGVLRDVVRNVSYFVHRWNLRRIVL